MYANMQEHDKVTDYLSTVTERLKADGFRIKENITYKNQIFRCVAKRTRFQPEFFGFAEFFFIFAEFPTLNRASLKEFSSKCFRYATWHRSVPSPLFARVICYPVALCNATGTDITESIHSNTPRRHWSAIEMPVVYNPKTRRLYYFKKTPFVGSAYWDYLRAMIISMLSP
jgi:hypothetical protein